MSDKYENSLVYAECETAEAAITRLVRSLRARGIEVRLEEIEAARRSASQLATHRYFG